MTNPGAGKQAETVAADYLVAKRYKIIDRNWRNRYGEIDIIVERDDCLFFVEVKYRSSSSQGSGIDYITPKKYKQMAFAAEMWVHDHRYEGQYRLAALEVSGPLFQVTSYIEID